MSIGSLLWIHGKRKLCLNFPVHNLMISDFRSGVWEKHSLVCGFPIIIMNDKNLELLQFCRHKTPYFLTRYRAGLLSVFLL